MQVKWIQISVKILRKWLLFIFLLAAVGAAIWYAVMPKGGDEARTILEEARKSIREGAEVVKQTQSPQDATFLELASDALASAEESMIENDYKNAVVEGRRSIDLSKKILERQGNQADGSGAVRFDELIGEVQVRRAEAKDYVPATSTMILGQGDVIKTSHKASCRLIFPDGMNTIISPNSLVTLKEAFEARNEDDKYMNLRLDTGGITLKSSQLSGKNKPTVITKSGSALVYHSSEVAMSYSAIQSETALSVYDGKATAASGAKTVDVLKNQQVIFTDDQTLGDLQDLPPAPNLVRPENYSKLESNGETSVVLGWSAVDTTASYHVELSPNILFTEHIHDTEKYFRNQIEYANLQPGVYFWRVSAIDGNNLKGAPSSTWQFQIGETLVSEMRTIDNKPPILKVEKVSVHGYMVIITGKTEKTATVQVDGQRAIMDLNTGKFSYTASMDSVGVHKILVIATDPAGNRTQREVPVQIKD